MTGLSIENISMRFDLPNGGAVQALQDVSLRLNEGELLSVQDNGPGIPKQDQMRLFEKFYRVKQRGTEKIKGSGLGLAIVRSIAERHGGRAWCISQQGEGCTFAISLPAYSNGYRPAPSQNYADEGESR